MVLYRFVLFFLQIYANPPQKNNGVHGNFVDDLSFITNIRTHHILKQSHRPN